jgi:hypothetical protein
MPLDQVAHDLAIAYVNNRYGATVTGEFSVDSTTNYETDTVNEVSGRGSVETHRMPDPFEPQMVRVGTGERHLFGLGPEKTRLQRTGAYEVDDVFRRMISDYRAAYDRFVHLLEIE